MKKEKKTKEKNNSNKKKNDIRKMKPVNAEFELTDDLVELKRYKK